jgi:multimeric flavodoxin WrbA
MDPDLRRDDVFKGEGIIKSQRVHKFLSLIRQAPHRHFTFAHGDITPSERAPPRSLKICLVDKAAHLVKMPVMKIIIFNGSPRGKASNTNIMVEAFSEGAREAGAEVENVFLVEKKIHHCMGCFHCWIKTPGKCTIKDDMAGLLEKFNGADLIVYATPLYIDNVSGLMKVFMDRLVPLADPHFGPDANGECRHAFQKGRKIPKIGVIANCGFPEQSHFQVLRLLFKRIARNMGSELAVEIYRAEGELMKNTSILLKPTLWNYKRLLEKAGTEVVKNGCLSAETTSALEKPLISRGTYIKKANKYWDEKLSVTST